MRRLTKDQYFLALANLTSARATCDRLWAGCVLVKDGEIVSTGYNGAPSGLPECDEVGHLLVDDHCRRAVHSEINAIYQAKKRLKNLDGVIAYINATPCENCLAELLKHGIKRIVCGSIYKNSERIDFTQKMALAFSAIVEYHPMPDIKLSLLSEVSDVKKIEIIKV